MLKSNDDQWSRKRTVEQAGFGDVHVQFEAGADDVGYDPDEAERSDDLGEVPVFEIQHQLSFVQDDEPEIEEVVEANLADDKLSVGGSSARTLYARQNQTITVSINEEIKYNQIRFVLFIAESSTRPKTALSKGQGDHVTGYVCFLEMLMEVTRGRSLQDCAEIIVETFIAVFPHKRGLFEHLRLDFNANIERICTPKVRHEVRDLLTWFLENKVALSQMPTIDLPAISFGEIDVSNIHENLKYAKQRAYANMIQQSAQKFLEKVNQDETIAFSREGKFKSEEGQGSKIKEATYQLKLYNELLRLSQNTASMSKENIEIFHGDFLQKHARCVSAFNATFGHQFESVRNTWHELNATEKSTEILNMKNQLKFIEEGIWFKSDAHYRKTNERYIVATGVERIANCIGELFDYKFDAVKNQDASEPDRLFLVTARHIIIMLKTFPALLNLHAGGSAQDFTEKVLDHFLEHIVLGKSPAQPGQGWYRYVSEACRNFGKFKENVMKQIDKSTGRLITSAEAQRNQQLLQFARVNTRSNSA